MIGDQEYHVCPVPIVFLTHLYLVTVWALTLCWDNLLSDLLQAVLWSRDNYRQRTCTGIRNAVSKITLKVQLLKPVSYYELCTPSNTAQCVDVKRSTKTASPKFEEQMKCIYTYFHLQISHLLESRSVGKLVSWTSPTIDFIGLFHPPTARAGSAWLRECPVEALAEMA